MPKMIVAPSILAADYANFQAELDMIETTSAPYIHLDVMDGQFVPNISFGSDVIKSMRPHSSRLFDCHMMVVDPERYIDSFKASGVDIMTIHVEATRHVHASLQAIRQSGMKVGIALNPGTPVDAVRHVLHLVDQVLVMTVNPGFGGQAYLPEMAEKIAALAKERSDRGLVFDIEVDGGIDPTTAACAKAAGANIFVAGSYLFRGDFKVNLVSLEAVIGD